MGNRRVLITIILLLGAMASTARACLWDSDTLAMEAKGMPDVMDVIVGRFERNPPLYYEMRLRRVTKELESRPGELGLYDDAAVACDRLGRHDEAIAWMEKKKAQLDRLNANDPAVKDHTYRYLANLGTFHAHRWFSRSADRANTDDLRRGRDLIAQAIELNPDAHFGREKYQLMVMEWVLDPPPLILDSALPTMLEDRLRDKRDGVLLPAGDPKTDPRQIDPSHAVKGLSGLIVLGNAWQSVDIYRALYDALKQDEFASLSYFAALRAEELARSGRRSMHPRSAGGEDLVRQMEVYVLVRDWRKPDQRRLFEIGRREADLWHEERTAFVTARLQTGRHPDTDPTFWDGYHERPRPVLMESTARQAAAWLMDLPLVAGIVAILAAAVLLVRWRAYRMKARQPSGD